MKRNAVLLFALLCMTAQGTWAQGWGTFAGRPSCTPYLHEAAMSRGEAPRRSVYDPIQTWDATRTYRQLVVLVEFADASFSCENPRERYGRRLSGRPSTRGLYIHNGTACLNDK